MVFPFIGAQSFLSIFDIDKGTMLSIRKVDAVDELELDNGVQAKKRTCYLPYFYFYHSKRTLHIQ